MITLSRDTWLAIGLLLLLVVITAAAAAQQTRQQTVPMYSSSSAERYGAKALAMWLSKLGYRVDTDLLANFILSDTTHLILMLEPSEPVSDQEWVQLDKWVKNGGTLLLAGNRFISHWAMNHYEVNQLFMDDVVTSTLAMQTPLWVAPPFNQSEPRPTSYLISERSDYITHLAVDDKQITISFVQGQGRVILSTAPFMLSNEGLKLKGNGEAVLNLVSMASPKGTVWFDEWHHGRRATTFEVVGPTNWLRYTSAGHALLYVMVVIFIALLLQGRHFGRPVPLRQDIVRRTPLEYITAIANLNRRAGHRTAIVAQYRHELKRRLGQRYRLNPTLDDKDYLAELSRFNPNLDVNALTQLLNNLKKSKMSETELIKVATEVSVWLKES